MVMFSDLNARLASAQKAARWSSLRETTSGTKDGKRPESCEVVKSAGDNQWNRRWQAPRKLRGGQIYGRQPVEPKIGSATSEKFYHENNDHGATCSFTPTKPKKDLSSLAFVIHRRSMKL